MAQATLLGPATELDLRYELRLNVTDLASGISIEPLGEWACSDAGPLEPLVQILGNSPRVTGADTSGTEHPLALVIAQDQGPDRLTRGCRRNIAGDDKLLPFGAFGF